MRLVVDLCKISAMGLIVTLFVPLKLVLIAAVWTLLLYKISFLRHFGDVTLGKI